LIDEGAVAKPLELKLSVGDKGGELADRREVFIEAGFLVPEAQSIEIKMKLATCHTWRRCTCRICK
jgi:hypothetical protein